MQIGSYTIEFKEKLTMKDWSDIFRVMNKWKSVSTWDNDNWFSYVFDMFAVLCMTINWSIKTQQEKLEFIQSITDFEVFNAIADEIDEIQKRESEITEEKKKTLNTALESDWTQAQ